MRMSRVESALRVVLEFNEACNRHDVAGMMRLMSDDCILENSGPAPDGAVYSGKEVEIFQVKNGFICEQLSYVKG